MPLDVFADGIGFLGDVVELLREREPEPLARVTVPLQHELANVVPVRRHVIIPQQRQPLPFRGKTGTQSLSILAGRRIVGDDNVGFERETKR